MAPAAQICNNRLDGASALDLAGLACVADHTSDPGAALCQHGNDVVREFACRPHYQG